MEVAFAVAERLADRGGNQIVLGTERTLPSTRFSSKRFLLSTTSLQIGN